MRSIKILQHIVFICWGLRPFVIIFFFKIKIKCVKDFELLTRLVNFHMSLFDYLRHYFVFPCLIKTTHRSLRGIQILLGKKKQNRFFRGWFLSTSCKLVSSGCCERKNQKQLKTKHFFTHGYGTVFNLLSASPIPFFEYNFFLLILWSKIVLNKCYFQTNFKSLRT